MFWNKSSKIRKGGFQTPHFFHFQNPGFRFPVGFGSTPLIWSTIELEGFPLNWSQALGTYPLILGSSGTFESTKFSLVFNSSTEHFVRLRIFAGKQLNNLGPWTWNELSLSVRILALELGFKLGMEQILPSLGFSFPSIPEFGTSP